MRKNEDQEARVVPETAKVEEYRCCKKGREKEGIVRERFDLYIVLHAYA